MKQSVVVIGIVFSLILVTASCGDEETLSDTASSSGLSLSSTSGVSSSGDPLSSSSSASSYSVPSLTQVSYRDLASLPGLAYDQISVTGDSFPNQLTAFKIGKYEVTYELWHTVCIKSAKNGYLFAHPGREGSDGIDGAVPSSNKFEPVTAISWRDCIVWCNAYSELAGLTPVYYTSAGHTTPIKDSRDGAYDSSINTTAGSFDAPYINWNATGYRLPTESEWQFAAGGYDLPCTYASGASATHTDTTASGAVAWYSGNSGSTTKVVGTKAANKDGIHDMSGNVWEWCHDWAGPWPTVTQSDYRGPATGSTRVYRGGSYYSSTQNLQIGYTANIAPFNINSGLGFRVACKP